MSIKNKIQRAKIALGKSITIALVLGTIYLVLTHAPQDTAEAKEPNVRDISVFCKDGISRFGCVNTEAQSEVLEELPADISDLPSPESTMQDIVDPEAKLALTDEVKANLAEKINQFTIAKGSPLGDKYGMVWVEMGIKYNRHPFAGVAVAFADTSLGKNLSTRYNLGNVGNTDSCPRCQAHANWESGIEAIFATLANKNLGKATKLCHLSQGGWSDCPDGANINGGKFYACSGGPIVGGRCQRISNYPDLPRSAPNWNRNTNYAISWLFSSEYKTDYSIILSDYYST